MEISAFVSLLREKDTVQSILSKKTNGNVKKVMKNQSEECGKTRETLPLAASPEGPLARREGGGKRVGVNGLRGTAKRLRKHSTEYSVT